jgi:hypothetical protein
MTLVACSKKQPPPANEFEAFERAYVEDMEFISKRLRDQGKDIADKDIPTSYRAVYIGPPGVFIDRKQVATLSELTSKRAELLAALDANAKLAPTFGYTGLSVTFDLDAQPATTAIEALRLFADRDTYFRRRAHDPEIPIKSTEILCGQMKLRDKPTNNPRFQEPQLSIFLAKDRAWVGLSQVNEFYDIPDLADKTRDFDKVQDTLRIHKAGKEFAERNDIELAASTGTAREVLAAFDLACNAGFNDIAVVAPDQLSARPEL